MRIDRDFLARPVLDVAPALLGALLQHDGVTLRLTEVEAYAGPADPGSHAYRGPTPRTEVMFGPPGHLYVYLSYGMHHCVNIVTGPDGTASAVLLRAAQVVEGLDLARERRQAGLSTPVTERDLARGPGRLTRALGLALRHDGLDLLAPEAEVRLRPGTRPPGVVRTGPRVGVSGEGGDGALFPWRFWIGDEPTVSAYRAAARRLGRAAPAGRHTPDEPQKDNDR
ncbi:DNA-3-methyladenine glycosylase [Ornithinimicrobium pratense]|uniref:Putative 3-methyladenine DNA glycosylase n=1 Tax=Ornithinimicrobium pratense TaxID=2593973 RepID=A0A5J6V6J8_9MICO|nr:DNA-3-methyladenine glycosylase [Ornithinimicrobium pratense]QFG68811.1 DNA-3-methyladenine glycosylase [Ornithinimicrobium pratense]